MTGIDRITEKILRDAARQADEIVRNAGMAAAAYIEKEHETLKAKKAELAAEADAGASLRMTRIISAEELELRKQNLSVRQRLIGEVYSMALDKLVKSPDTEYAGMLVRMAVKAVEENRDVAAPGEKGLMLVTQNDRKRLPSDFNDMVNDRLARKGIKTVLELSEEAAAGISGGLIVRFGDIEINSSFESLIMAGKNDFEPVIKGILFGDGGNAFG
ncbi:MAG: V-type ATP synthase subunit E [Eubacteriales bacterium]|nr:V-type ATP synthase subunit E [Eubacteriales bacterium]